MAWARLSEQVANGNPGYISAIWRGMFLFRDRKSTERRLQRCWPQSGYQPKIDQGVGKGHEQTLDFTKYPQNCDEDGILGEMSYILFASQRVSSKKIEEEGFIFEYQNICRALDDLYGKSGTNSSKAI